MSPSTPSRARNNPAPSVVTSLLRSPRKYCRRFALYGCESPASSVLCCALLILLPEPVFHWKAMPCPPSQLSMVRFAGPCAAAAPVPVLRQGLPLGTPVRLHDASQLARAAMAMLVPSNNRLFAVNRPLLSPGKYKAR